MKENKKQNQWTWIKGSWGYGHEIVRKRNGDPPPMRVCILDCQESVYDEHNSGFSIVPEANLDIGSDEHLESVSKRFTDEEMEMNAKMIRATPQMYELLKMSYPHLPQDMAYEVAELIHNIDREWVWEEPLGRN